MKHKDLTAGQSEETLLFKDLLRKCPMLAVILVFVFALAVGGLLRMSFAMFTFLAIIGGFALPIIYGARIGLAPQESIILCLAIFTFLSYASLCILCHLERYASAKRYLKALKSSFRPVYRFLKVYAGRIGILGILALSTFLAGWWLAVMIAFITELEILHAMSGIFVGLVAGGLLAWGLYYGIERAVTSPLLLASIFIGIGLAVGTVMQILVARMRMRRRIRGKKSSA